jgi:ketosteroid isomerase-like protein
MEVVEAFQEAYNGHDLDRLMALYAANASFEVLEAFSLRGKEELRDLAEHDFVLNVQMSCSQFDDRGDSVMCHLTETNDWLRTAGVARARYAAIFVVQGGRITSVRAEPDPATVQAYQTVSIPLLAWANQESPELVKEMMPEGQFLYNAENAKHFLSLLREWKQVHRREALKPAWRKLGD